jgi:hypothetical protein
MSSQAVEIIKARTPAQVAWGAISVAALSIAIAVASLGVALSHAGPGGPAGPQGTQGQPGIAGPQGATGPQGPIYDGQQRCTIVQTDDGNGYFNPPTAYEFICEPYGPHNP